MRYLITGYNGFIGKNLVKYLSDLGHYVAGYDRHTSSLESLLSSDIFDCIVHLAANVENNDSIEHFENVSITKELVYQASIHCPEVKIIYSSTVNVYESPTSPRCNEESKVKPRTLYEYSKLMSEYAVEKHQNYVILRFSNVYGPGINNGVIFDWLRKDKVIFGTKEEASNATRTFTNVDDICHAVYLVSQDYNISGEIFNVCDDKNISLLDLADMMNKDVVFRNVKTGYTSYYPSADKLKSVTSWNTKSSIQDDITKIITDYNNGIY